jgi:acyl-CoA thioesterase-1
MIASAQDNAPAKPKPPRKPNPVLAQIEDVAGLPRVLLIGDSISMGYTLPTRKLLEGKANVHRIPTNGGPTSRGVESMTKWLGDGTWDVIHFNWGLHDLKRMDDGKHQIAIEDYEKNLRTLVAQLKETGATLIWASTTPVPDADMKPPRSNDDVIKYNEVAAKVMADNEIQIDDLYAFCLPQLTELQRPANVHFTPQGSAELAKQVAKVIEAALPAK